MRGKIKIAGVYPLRLQCQKKLTRTERPKRISVITPATKDNIQPGTEKSKTRFQLKEPSEDSEGNDLTDQQKEFFKDSKIVTEDGNLKVMYHGSPNEFTVFDRKKARSSAYFGKGFYFSDSSNQAGVYGNNYKVYLNIKNPIHAGTNDITKPSLENLFRQLLKMKTTELIIMGMMLQ